MISDTRMTMLMDREVRRVETRAVTAAKKILRGFQLGVLRSYRAGNLDVTTDLQRLTDNLGDAMYVAHLLGIKRGQLQFRRGRKELELSVFDETIKVLEKQLKIRTVNKLQRTFNTEALRVMNDVTNRIEQMLRQTVNDLIQGQVPTRQATSILRKRFDALGVSPNNDFQVETIYRTQSQISYNAGRYKADQDLDVQEILWGYKYVTAGDDRVRPSHEALDGVTLPKDNPFWDQFWPPNGWNCRCQVIPIYEKRRIKRPPKNVEPDPGFNFNPGVVFS